MENANAQSETGTRRRRQIWIWVLGPILILFAIGLWRHIVLFGPVSGKITDIVTKEPIAGVQADLMISKYDFSFHPSHSYMWRSAFTDREGNYKFPLSIGFLPLMGSYDGRIFVVNPMGFQSNAALDPERERHNTLRGPFKRETEYEFLTIPDGYQEKYEFYNDHTIIDDDWNGWQPFSKKNVAIMSYSRGAEYCMRVSTDKYKQCIEGVSWYETDPTVCDLYSKKQEEIEKCYEFMISKIEPEITSPGFFGSSRGYCAYRKDLSVCYKEFKSRRSTNSEPSKEGKISPEMGL